VFCGCGLLCLLGFVGWGCVFGVCVLVWWWVGFCGVFGWFWCVFGVLVLFSDTRFGVCLVLFSIGDFGTMLRNGVFPGGDFSPKKGCVKLCVNDSRRLGDIRSAKVTAV